jgi:uncharacterized protein YigE (DUF2233 family)
MALKQGLCALVLLGVLCGCSIADLAPGLTSTTAAPRPAGTPRPTATPIPPDTGWQAIAPGLEYRELTIRQERRSERVKIARVDPAQVQLRVLYQPDRPQRVSEWLSESQALLAVNGNYFDPQNHALGLVIQDGQRRDGVVYEGFGGMFAVSGDTARVRWNVQEPYSGEPLTYALQNFPMLVLPGGAPNLAIDDNGRAAPRTVVAQDRSGRLVFLASPGPFFTLTGLGQWLAAGDLDLDRALNLDGGTSTGLLLRAGERSLGTDSWVGVPNVIVVESR